MRLVPLERRQKLTQNRLWNDLIQLCYEGRTLNCGMWSYEVSNACLSWIKETEIELGVMHKLLDESQRIKA
jgi:hypothetical protein